MKWDARGPPPLLVKIAPDLTEADMSGEPGALPAVVKQSLSEGWGWGRVCVGGQRGWGATSRAKFASHYLPACAAEQKGRLPSCPPQLCPEPPQPAGPAEYAADQSCALCL